MSQTSPILPAQIPAQPKSWLARKWKLLLGLLVALGMLGIAVVFGILTLIMSLLKGSDVAKEAMARARSNPAVVQHLGTPIEVGWFVSGSINVSNGSGDADLTLPISGPKGKGTLYVTAQKSAGTWTYRLMQAAIKGSGEKIDLLAPDEANAHNSPGIGLGQKGNLDGAIAEFREAVRLKPDLPEAHYNLGFALAQKGDLDGAIAEYREAVRLKPDDADAHNSLGSALQAKGKSPEALEEYQKACQLAPNDIDSCAKAKKLSGG